jgi:drug/metabolite transporter (DMT)-like permease
MLGGFMWVVGDLFQNYAAKYVGISRGIPLSNTNQLWGLLWAVLVFHELHGLTAHIYAEVIGGSVIMVLGSLAIASSSASENEYASWQQAARRETDLYCIDPVYVASRGEGRELTSESADGKSGGRTWGDWLLVTVATLIFVALALIARVPHMEIQMGWLFVLTGAMLVALVAGCIALWRVTRFI